MYMKTPNRVHETVVMSPKTPNRVHDTVVITPMTGLLGEAEDLKYA